MLALNEAIMHPYHHMHHPPLIQGSPQQHKTTPNVQLRSVGRNITLFIVAISQIYPVTSPVTLELGKPSKKKIKSVDFFHRGGGSTPNPHFFLKNKHGLKMCFKSFLAI